jgi:hypothetical protein
MAEQAVAMFPDRLVPYVYALPRYEKRVCEELEEALSERGFRGVKIHASECSLAEYVIDPVLELAARYQVPCLIDVLGWYAATESLVSRCPRTKVIIAHLGQYLCSDQQLVDRFISLAEKNSNVFLDISGVALLPKIKEAAARIGSNRLIWGSDGPHPAPDTVSFAKMELDKVRIVGLEKHAEEDILGGSLQRLLGL